MLFSDKEVLHTMHMVAHECLDIRTVTMGISLLEARVDRSEELLFICSWCKRIELPDDGWTEVEPGGRKLDLFGATALPQLSHSICPECEARTAVD